MSILAGLDAIFDRHLQVEDVGSSSPHYQHKTGALRLSTGRPRGFDAQKLLEEAYARLVSNLECSPRLRRGPSRENWRFDKQLNLSPQNPSPEVTLERAIAGATGSDWANQVPTASGLWDHTADKRRAVDLVHCIGHGSFELIELKVNSHTPLRAAVEIVQYALLFCLARNRYAEQDLACKELLRAKEVHLRVLAPIDYYSPYTLGWLERDFDAALRAFSLQPSGETPIASFSFEAFPTGFCWPAPVGDLVDQLNNRRRVWTARRAAAFGEGLVGATPPS